ncbi:Spp2/MOS2, G-patch domain [Phytophthora cactorum]|nr:Spp2/MOS2, G-patch domain [Phytophthora cactorum]
MKLGGFALKKGKKKALGAPAGFSASVPTALQVTEKVFVTDFDPNAPTSLTEDGKKPLVIPLLETNAWTNDPNGGRTGASNDIKGISEDEQAAAQIIAETQAARNTQSSDKDLVIPVEREQKRAELFQDGDKRPNNGQKMPILQQNAVPGLDDLQDVADKYRHDVALRPEAPDVHSDVYESVPVEAFGAALLRGMGWTGDVDPDDVGVAPQPRHKLLGLGATKRPSLPGEGKKKRKKRKEESNDRDRRSGLNTDKPQRGDKERRSSRSADRDRRRRSRSQDRRKRSRSRDRERDRDGKRDRDREGRRDRSRDRDRDRRRRSHSRDRHNRRR